MVLARSDLAMEQLCRRVNMTWILDAIGAERVAQAREEANRRRTRSALQLGHEAQLPDDALAEIGAALELRVFDLLASGAAGDLRSACADAFQVIRAVPEPDEPIERATWLLRLACIATLGDRGADIKRHLVEHGIPDLPCDDQNWGRRVWAMTLDTWLRAARKHGWEDLDRIQQNVVTLREAQADHEPQFLAGLEDSGDLGPAWQLIAEYHLAKAAEVFALFIAQGAGHDGRFDIHQQLEAQFDRVIGACSRGGLIELEVLSRLLARAATAMVNNSIWSVTRAVNSRVTKFVEDVVSRTRHRPIFEMLPPQRHTLREAGLLGSAHRSVVVSLPTSSGKTMIAQFRILQALNQFEMERGWVAFLAPTRALVKQLTIRLRRDFAAIGVGVEQVSPALEVDGIEAQMLREQDEDSQFRVLVTTPEKLDLMLRSGWEQEIGRPLTLVVVDEAHNLQSRGRGLKLELLLATINRECKHAQFLLLTPFIDNAQEVAAWLDPESHNSVDFALDWMPNDRVVAIATPKRGDKRGSFTVSLAVRHTSKPTLEVPDSFELPQVRPLGLSWSDAKAPGTLAAATAHQLRDRGTVLVLAGTVPGCWSLARRLVVDDNKRPKDSPEIELVKRFLSEEFGPDFALIELLGHGVGVHHAGMSDEAKALVEWLTEERHLDVLVATTTLAQGVNFPVSAVVFASYQYPYGQDLTPEEFWNVAGRAGRVDQGDLGIVALAADTPKKEKALEAYLQRAVGTLNSSLVAMVQEAYGQGRLLNLKGLSAQPEWSSFLQYLVHTYRMLGDHDAFAHEVEQVLRGTLGFAELRRSHPTMAATLVNGVRIYGEQLQGKPLKLVDHTGFSIETVMGTLGRLSTSRIEASDWTPELFESQGSTTLPDMMGLLLQVPELRDNLEAVTGTESPNGDLLARIVQDWVGGHSLPEMASKFFPHEDATTSMSKCCKQLFGKLTQTASWGLAALQVLSLGDAFDGLSAAEQRSVRNLPARVFYGVNNDAALTLRLNGVPRKAAAPLASVLAVSETTSVGEVRKTLRERGDVPWTQALGVLGPVYHKVWSVVEGEPV